MDQFMGWSREGHSAENRDGEVLANLPATLDDINKVDVVDASPSQCLVGASCRVQKSG